MDLLLLGILHLCLTAYLHRQFAYGELTPVSEKTCICPGDIVSYECTVMSYFGGETTFMSPFFDCNGHGANDELTLFHKGFTSGGVGDTISCNNGTIVGHGSSSENGVYTSQLDITVTLDLIGRTIECLHNNGTHRYKVGMAVINETGRPSSSLDKIYISKVGFHPNQLTFHWNSVASDCSTVHYDIEASTDCGSCPTTTNHTTVTCIESDIPTSGGMCNFTVSTVICENITITDQSGVIYVSLDAILPQKDLLTALISTDVILLLIIIILIALFLCYILATRLKRSKGYESNPTQDSSTPHAKASYEVVVKAFDNENMGTYGTTSEPLEYEVPIQTKGLTNTIEDQPVDLSHLMIHLQNRFSSRWYLYGVAIGVPKEFLEQLKDHPEHNCLTKVLEYWLRHHPDQPTWSEVVEAQKKLDFYDIARKSY